MAVIDAGAHSEHVQLIKCDVKPGSVEKSIVRLLSWGSIFIINTISILIVLYLNKGPSICSGSF
jgi:hypothetical protein